MHIREATERDAGALKALYFEHLTAHPPAEEQDMTAWREKLRAFCEDENYHLLALEEDGQVVASVTLVVIPNLTHNLRPYAIVENVVTHRDHRGRGYATALMRRAAEIAKESNCYKIMLMTGSKRESTLGFYRKCGFNSEDKTGFVMWL